MEKQRPTWELVAEFVVKVIITVIIVRMLLGLLMLVFKVAGWTIDWLQAGAPFDVLPFRWHDYAIFALVIVAFLVHDVIKSRQTPEIEAESKADSTSL